MHYSDFTIEPSSTPYRHGVHAAFKVFVSIESNRVESINNRIRLLIKIKSLLIALLRFIGFLVNAKCL